MTRAYADAFLMKYARTPSGRPPYETPAAFEVWLNQDPARKARWDVWVAACEQCSPDEFPDPEL